MSAFDDLVALADRAVFAALGGEVITVTTASGSLPFPLSTPLGAGSAPVTGMFSEMYVLANGFAHAGVETLGPAVFFRLEDLPSDLNLEEDDATFTIRSKDYRIVERRPDGIGGVVLVLRLRS